MIHFIKGFGQIYSAHVYCRAAVDVMVDHFSNAVNGVRTTETRFKSELTVRG